MIRQLYERWLAETEAYPELNGELQSIFGQEKEIEDRFYRELSFGTGGLRGVLGAGTNRMNRFTVAKATFGLAEYLRAAAGESGSVVIAYDSRRHSAEFARLVAEIMSSRGVRAYLFEELMPTPVLSYAVRKLNATAGVVITASHNPAVYNGYKVYNEHGCQITDEAAAKITSFIAQADGFAPFKADESRIELLGEDMLECFLDEIETLSLGTCRNGGPSVVYTPLNGTGNRPVRKILGRIGVTRVDVVKEQELPDGDFTTCPYPNPENRAALTLALALAKEKGAELVLATDPDADRVGVAVRDGEEYRLLTGNETGVLLEDYLLACRKRAGKLPPRPVIVKTIVTTDMAKDIAKEYGAEVIEVLTGFKYIGETIDRLFDETRFVMGLEESYGYLIGRHARDKDAVSACMAIAEMTAYYRAQGKSLYRALRELYEKYGFYRSRLLSKEYPGKAGKEEMNAVLCGLRKRPWKEIAGRAVLCAKDYSNGEDGLPPSDVLSFEGEGFKIIVRPSGTEPKMKVYLQAKGKDEAESEALLSSLTEFAEHNL